MATCRKRKNTATLLSPQGTRGGTSGTGCPSWPTEVGDWVRAGRGDQGPARQVSAGTGRYCRCRAAQYSPYLAPVCVVGRPLIVKGRPRPTLLFCSCWCTLASRLGSGNERQHDNWWQWQVRSVRSGTAARCLPPAHTGWVVWVGGGSTPRRSFTTLHRPHGPARSTLASGLAGGWGRTTHYHSESCINATLSGGGRSTPHLRCRSRSVLALCVSLTLNCL
ncbi:hypothetical protein Pcinc_013157 [Petrolisthes cinctipes]|uniref:Uncharacterized protein n=1 Tax=Petrolisthes cinctipes TaxID=88211 RepID=A0AAE1FXX5_PETCI|nr:hypothetical protein Pcinc_013157 [Petrolisthes cinctipes]